MRQGDIQTVGIVFPNERMQLTGPALLASDVQSRSSRPGN
jgi:hypothetical protein